MNCIKPDSLYYVFSQLIGLHYHRIRMLLDKVDIYPGQPPMLYFLNEKDGRNQNELAQKLRIKPATITVMLNRMEKAQLVERRPDPNDQRASRVYITEKGREVWRKVLEIMKTIEAECFSNFTKEEQDLLLSLFLRMKDNLEKVNNNKSDI